MAYKLVIALLAVPLLSSCLQGGEVVVTQSGRDIIFEVTDKGGEKICPDMLDVGVRREGQRNLDVWTIINERDVCVSRFVYGQTPPGFREAVAPRPLTAGTLYSVSASVPGYLVLNLFSPGDRDGVINRELPPE